MIGLAVCYAISAASIALATPTVTWLGTLDGVPGNGAALGVSPDGLTVVGGAASNAASGHSAFKWTAAGGMSKLPSSGQGNGVDTTNGGTVVAGYETLIPSSFWGRYWFNGVGSTIGQVPGGSPGTIFTRGVSNDGSIIVGECYGGSTIGTVALRWTSSTGSVALPRLSTSGFYSTANAISGDGSTIVGMSEDSDRNTVAVRWTSSGVSPVGDLPGGSINGSASGVSPDGSIIVGSSSSTASGGGGFEAFRWTPATGMQPLGLLGRQLSHAYDVSADGSVVVGYSAWFSEEHAFIWSPTTGMLDMNTYLSNLGMSLGSWSFDVAHGVSDDGRTIVGVGRRTPTGNDEPFVVSIPEPASVASFWALTLLSLRRRR